MYIYITIVLLVYYYYYSTNACRQAVLVQVASIALRVSVTKAGRREQFVIHTENRFTTTF